MNILYAFQGTGNGHVSRAREIIPLLQRYGKVDVLMSGTQADMDLPFDMKYRFHGFSFVFGKKGGVHHWNTVLNMNLRQFVKDCRSLPLQYYHLIINDFEPVSAWACKLQGIESVAMSHQCAFVSKNTPRPTKGWNWEEMIFKYYAPTTQHIGFHFQEYDNFIHTPVIRSEIRQLQTQNKGHYTVYLPAYDDITVMQHLLKVPHIQWEVFSKHQKISYRNKNVWVRRIENESFNKSMANCEGLLTGGGFESPAEALFLGKKLMVIPMSYQYEQQCNAIALKRMGIPVIARIEDDFSDKLSQWIANSTAQKIDFPDKIAQIVDDVIKKYARL